MKTSQNSPKKNRIERPSPLQGSKYANRLAVAAGSLAGLALAPESAEAARVVVNDRPVSMGLSAADGASVTWDIDGVGTGEFRIMRGTYALFIASNTVSGGRGNGRGMVAPGSSGGDDVVALNSSFQVAPSNNWGGSFARNGYYPYRNAVYSDGAIGYDFYYGFAPGDNFVGFRFDDGVGSGLNYGYGVFNFDTTNGILTISQWVYESEDDFAVHLEAIPEPSSLALLAIGAGGLLTYRSRRKSLTAA